MFGRNETSVPNLKVDDSVILSRNPYLACLPMTYLGYVLLLFRICLGVIEPLGEPVTQGR